MKAYCYILYSKTLERYYVGSTILKTEERLKQHLQSHYGITKFTHRAKDWELFLEIECESLQQARKLEAYIKKMKSKQYIQYMKTNPELIIKLLDQFSFKQD